MKGWGALVRWAPFFDDQNVSPPVAWQPQPGTAGQPASASRLSGATICRVHLAAATNLANNAVTVIPYDTDDEDTAAAFVAPTFTVKTAGLYLVSLRTNFGLLGAGSGSVLCEIHQNGVAAIKGNQVPLSTTTGSSVGAQGLLRCAVNDTIQGAAYQTNTGAAGLAYNTGPAATGMDILQVAA